jgi:D-amino-acid dehydrogenase
MLNFVAECTPGRTRENMRNIVALALYSRAQLVALRQDTGIEYDQLTRGILHFYTDARELELATSAAAVMREFGCDRQTVTADECVRIEPALTSARPLLVGGDFTASDESGDAHKFTRELAKLAVAQGVKFRYGQTVAGIDSAGGKATGFRLASGRVVADAYLIAGGSWSPALLAPLGIRLPIYPAKGYSATLTLSEASVAPTVSLTDDGHKIVFSRLGQRLRIAGTAEFNGFNAELNPARCTALIRRASRIFPELHTTGAPEFWCGLRPATPSNVPYIGRTRLPNLWINAGHGTLGWTMACGSGAAIADIISGRRPEPDFPFK